MTQIKTQLSLLLIFCCAALAQSQSTYITDTATNNLYKNLKLLSETGKIMFGMANPTTISYVGKQNNNINKSDCKDITGSHPAFHESDFMWYNNNEYFRKIDTQAMKAAKERGAVIGYCWHMLGRHSNSFRSKNNNDDLSADSLLVKEIVSDNNRNKNDALNWYLTQLDSIVIPIFKKLNCPIIYRPFHEMNGHWFWWGSDNCTPQEYILLFRLTVDYLRKQNLKNLLYVWAPDKKPDFSYYPGGSYVDIIGLDIYEPGIAYYSQSDTVLKNISTITDYASKHNKVAAITETGCRKAADGKFRYPDYYPDFWTKYVLYPLLSAQETKRIAYIMSWYGSNWDDDYSTEMYIPYKNCKRPNIDKAIADFKLFYNNDATLFETDLPDLYK